MAQGARALVRTHRDGPMAERHSNVCSWCGSVIPPGNLGSRCASCLLRLALGELDDREDAGPTGEEEAAAERPHPLRRCIGDYELLEEIARGGMGVVYRARQLSVGRLVALKMLHGSEGASPAARLRFQVEAAAVGRLNHSNIVSLIESGECDGALFLVMNLVEGPSLAQASRECASRDRTWLRRAARIMAVSARAVHHAHQRGVLHRDLKPSNILLDGDEPRIADFGLAKIRESDAGLTRTDSLLGSPNYMPPEQACGPAHLVTTAADVYSLGAILYEMACGGPPFAAPTAVETLRRVVDSPPPSLRRQNPCVDRDLEAICLRSLEKEPQRRYASAAELADDLERWLERRPVAARAISPAARAARWCRRNPALAGLAAVSLVCAAAIAFGSVIAMRRIQNANREAHMLLRRLQREQAESFLDRGDSARGIAVLARMVREDSGDDGTGMRLMSALMHRPIARPVVEPWVSGSEIVAVGFDGGGDQSVAVSRSGVVHRRRLSTGAVSEPGVSAGAPLERAALSSDLRWLAAADGTGIMMIWNLEEPAGDGIRIERDAAVTLLRFRGRLLATGWADGSVEVRDLDTGRLTRAPLEHPAGVRAACFGPGGAELATGCEDGFVRIWPLWSDAPPRVLPQLAGAVRVVSFDSQGDLFGAGTVNGHVRMWHLREGRQTDLKATANLTDLQFSPDGEWIAVAGWSAEFAAQVWNARTGEPVPSRLRHRNHVTRVRFSPDSRMLLTASEDGTARIWSTRDWRPWLDPLVHIGGVLDAVWHPDGRRLLTSSFAGAVWWEMPGRDTGPEALPESNIVAMAAAPGRIVTLTTNGVLRERTPAGIRAWNLPLAAICDAAFSPSGQLAAVLPSRRELRVIQTGPEDFARPAGSAVLPADVLFLAVPDSGAVVFAGLMDGSLWRVPATGERARELCRVEGLRGVATSPDERWVATFSSADLARLWDARSGRPSSPPMVHDGYVDRGAFSPDGRLLVTASRDARARVWRVPEGELATTPLAHNAQVHDVAFDPSGRLLATTSADGSTRVWRMDALDTAPIVIEHGGDVRRAVFSPEGRWLLTVTAGTIARMWDPRTALPVTEILLHEAEITAAGFMPGGDALWTQTADGAAHVWRLPAYRVADARWLPDAAEVLGRMQLGESGQFRVTAAGQWTSYARWRSRIHGHAE